MTAGACFYVCSLILGLFCWLQTSEAACLMTPDAQGSVVIDEGNTTIPDEAFYHCSELKSITFPISSLVNIGHFAFASSGLVNLDIPDSVTELGNGTCHRCIALRSVTLPNGLETVPAKSFAYCTSLGTTVLPNSVVTVGADAFRETSHKEVTLPANVRTVGAMAYAQSIDGISSLTIASKNIAFSDSAFYLSGLVTDELMIVKGAQSITGLVYDLTRLQCVNGECTCGLGYGNGLTDPLLSDFYFRCVACEAGKTNNPPSINACQECSEGSYAPHLASLSCTQCPAGKFGTQKGQTSPLTCNNCTLGKYGNMLGASECIICPAGTYGNVQGLTHPLPCPPGEYTDVSGQTMCQLCSPGRYQPESNSAKCLLCGAGKYNRDIGSINYNTSCHACEPGTYAGQNGTAECSLCTDGQFQPNRGGSYCEVCTEYHNDKMLTSNAQHTECVVNPAFISESLVQSLFLDGGAYIVTSIIVAAFLSIAGIMHFKREAQLHMLGSLTRWETFVKSFLPGFSFGSEMLLMFGIWTQRGGLAGAMFFFRLFHCYGLMMLSALIFGSERIPKYFEKWLPRAPDYTHDMHHQFARENIALVGAIMFLSLCDITYVQFLPWKKARFFIESKGFPDMHVMLFCLGIKTVQAFVSLVCVCTYLYTTYDVKGPTMSAQAKGLFFLNILFSATGVVIGLLLLVIKNKLLAEVENEKKEQAQRRKTLSTLDLGGVDLEKLCDDLEEMEEGERERRGSLGTIGTHDEIVRRLSANLETFDGSALAALVRRSSVSSETGEDSDNQGSPGSLRERTRASSRDGSFTMHVNPLHVREMEDKDEVLRQMDAKVKAQGREIEALRSQLGLGPGSPVSAPTSPGHHSPAADDEVVMTTNPMLLLSPGAGADKEKKGSEGATKPIDSGAEKKDADDSPPSGQDKRESKVWPIRMVATPSVDDVPRPL